MNTRKKVLCFYLPQFHPIKENDEWWGEGFTEWRNVSQARPRYSGHYQPHVPGALGFYDLRLSEVRSRQAQLAAAHGIAGFCYYHYWFNGKMLLDRPLSEVLVSGEPDFPFCLCWANENWTRAWDGLDRQVLIRQDYTESDAEAHIKWFIRAFTDPRYIKINGKPLLLIYRPDHIPDAGNTITLWRKMVESAGFPGLYLCAVKNGFVEQTDAEILAVGYDALVDFQPNRLDFPAPSGAKQAVYWAARKWLPNGIYQWLKASSSALNIIDYRAMVSGLVRKKWPREYKKFPCVFPSWDNSARRKTPTVIQNLDPSTYGAWLKDSLEKVEPYPDEEKIVFINAWNEWAEGCHLEPDLRFGAAFLEETRRLILADEKSAKANAQ
jgi:lipopolysaccharide biosynthesis protein